MTGAQLLDFADSKASNFLCGLPLPQHLKTAGLSRLSSSSSPADDFTFRSTVFTPDQASQKLKDYFAAIADELKDDPLVLRICDGESLKPVLEDEDDFAMLAEKVFTDLDVEDKGKIPKSEIRNALVLLGVGMGIPPFSEFPQINDILKKHGVDEEQELGQSQFAEALQSVLEEVADALAENNVTVFGDTKIFNGSRLRKLLADKDQFNSVVEKMLPGNHSGQDGQATVELIRAFLVENGTELGVPAPSEFSESVDHLYDEVFSEVKDGVALKLDDTRELVKEILMSFVQKLEANPIYIEAYE
ncbi:uncharacterized protein LOC110809698 [Carica papaya]|uniref:uncharacterized protein LOC110809698 n=1 Tax=Carica papaya TaxID=3649 RepID=UPI000B8CF831|nr:uncharacterized protein LOC110809698 [Carica papaya]